MSSVEGAQTAEGGLHKLRAVAEGELRAKEPTDDVPRPLAKTDEKVDEPKLILPRKATQPIPVIREPVPEPNPPAPRR